MRPAPGFGPVEGCLPARPPARQGGRAPEPRTGLRGARVPVLLAHLSYRARPSPGRQEKAPPCVCAPHPPTCTMLPSPRCVRNRNHLVGGRARQGATMAVVVVNDIVVNNREALFTDPFQ